MVLQNAAIELMQSWKGFLKSSMLQVNLKVPIDAVKTCTLFARGEAVPEAVPDLMQSILDDGAGNTYAGAVFDAHPHSTTPDGSRLSY